ncbi:MAG: hypothetical protein V3574_01335 [Candidatus Moraniibacteriota bacterium]
MSLRGYSRGNPVRDTRHYNEIATVVLNTPVRYYLMGQAKITRNDNLFSSLRGYSRGNLQKNQKKPEFRMSIRVFESESEFLNHDFIGSLQAVIIKREIIIPSQGED